MSAITRCDSCDRLRFDVQIDHHSPSGINVCVDQESCRAAWTHDQREARLASLEAELAMARAENEVLLRVAKVCHAEADALRAENAALKEELAKEKDVSARAVAGAELNTRENWAKAKEIAALRAAAKEDAEAIARCLKVNEALRETQGKLVGALNEIFTGGLNDWQYDTIREALAIVAAKPEAKGVGND